MHKNALKSADELAWEFVMTELQRKSFEPVAIMARLAGTVARRDESAPTPSNS